MPMSLLLLALALSVATAAQGGKTCEARELRETRLEAMCKQPARRHTRLAAAAAGFRLGTIGVPAAPILH